jgi:hypothetical protein
MWSRLGHRVVWQMVMNDFEEHTVSLFKVGRWRQYVLTETSVPTSQTTQSHNSEDYSFES